MLKSGEISVTGDVWPTFLYRDHTFNDENPWDGLLEGELLVLVHSVCLRSADPPPHMRFFNFNRPTNTSSPRLAPSRATFEPLDLVTLRYMV